MVEREEVEEAVLGTLERVDVISIVSHQEDVSHISLIGAPADVAALDTYLSKHKRKDQREEEDSPNG